MGRRKAHGSKGPYGRQKVEPREDRVLSWVKAHSQCSGEEEPTGKRRRKYLSEEEEKELPSAEHYTEEAGGSGKPAGKEQKGKRRRKDLSKEEEKELRPHGRTDNAAESRKPGIIEPNKLEDKKFMPAKLREDLFNKFKGVNIYVDSEFASPAKVWFLSSEEYPGLDKSYEIVYADTWEALVPDFKQYSSKWENAALAGHPEEKKDMCAIMSILETMADCLIWRRESQSWVSDEREDKYTQKLQEIQDKNIQVIYMFDNHLLMGIVNRMASAVGRRAVEAVLTCAAIVAANGVRANRAVAYPVGSSRDVSESFPVDIIHSRRRSVSLEHDLRSLDENPREDHNYESDSNVSGSWKDGELYSDVILACGHHPNFPHFLFLSEIKSEAKLPQRHEDQLLRQMLAGIMHQTVVFGLLMGSTDATLFVMKHHFENKKIHTIGCQYNIRPDPTSHKFPTEKIKKLFIDIVAAIEYCSQNIKEIYHGF